MSTKTIVAAIIVGSIIVSAGIALRKTEYEACYDAYVTNSTANGAPENGAKWGAVRACSPS